MFGKIIIPTVLAMLFIFQGSGVCAAEYALSPALDVIAKDIGLVKSTVITKELKFDRKDFEETFGIPLETITVTSLPDRECGVLKYAGSDVREGLEIPAANIKLLKFTPSRSVGGAQFEVCADGNERLCATCRVSVLSGRNYAPYGGDMKVSALAGIGVVKALDAYDPDGDGISAEITEYPEKGIVKLCGNSFVYTALTGFEGKDSFTYRVTDSHGNASQTATVELDVRDIATDTRYSDMSGHWGYTGAMRLTELGLMNGEEHGGKLCFSPDKPVSRGDFLAMAMICAGLEEKVQPDSRTTFADNSEIPANIRSYASYAQSCGIIKGISHSDGTVFRSDTTITRAEAASILSGILGKSDVASEFNFTDVAAIPDWAKDSFKSLVSLGIINGSPTGALEPQSELTRAQAAQLLCNVIDYIEQQ